MDHYYTTRLVVRTTDELKGAYLAVCKARNVVASEEIREFMAKAIADALQDDRQVKVLKNASRVKTDSPQSEKAEKCDNTADMFDAETR